MKPLFTPCTCIALFLLLGLPAGAARAQTPNINAATSYVENNAEALGLTADDVRSYRISDAYVSRHTGVSHVYLTQQYQGIDVHNALINVNVQRDGTIFGVGNRFIAKLREKIAGSTVGLPAVGAAEAAAAHLGLTVSEPFTVLATEPGPMQATRLSDGGVSLEEVPAKLVYQPLENGEVRLAWNVGIYTLDGTHGWQVRVDAATGAFLVKDDLVVEDHWGPRAEAEGMQVGAAFRLEAAPPNMLERLRRNPDSYRVYPLPVESPVHTTPLPPADARVLVSNPADGTASPFGWHDTDGVAGPEFTITRGNNVHAYADNDANNAPDTSPIGEPDGGSSLDFDFPIDLTIDPHGSNDNIRSAITNLFYWNNIVHDVMYQYGFDEPSGNYQVNNYGKGGLGNDDVRAEGQDGGFNCNAFFFPTADGMRGRMEMFLCTQATPRRDGDLDNGVIVHEYAHGISTRLTGGPGTVSCLSGSEQAGEGWSDIYAILLTQAASDTGPGSKGVGSYLLPASSGGSGTIRPRPYSTDFAVNNFTYDRIKTASVPHGVGHVWATMVWDLNWALIGGDPNFPDIPGGGDDGSGGGNGFNPDLYGGNGGNNLALQLVTDGLKLQPCNPGFVDARDAILAADAALTGGLNECAIWHVFARRGLGFSASQGNPLSRSDGTEAFDLPPGTPSVCPGGTPPPPPPFTIRFRNNNPFFINSKGVQKAVVRWNIADVSTNKIDIYVAEEPASPLPDGTPNKRTKNDSKHKQKVPVGSGGPLYNIQACEKNSTTVCSNVIQADFTNAVFSDEPDDDDEAGKGAAEVPEEFALRGNYPNPFNPSTQIQFDLPSPAEVTVEVVDVLGRVVLRVPSQRVAAGFSRGVEVDGSRLASGTYVYRLTARMEEAVEVSTGRMVLQVSRAFRGERL